MKRWQEACEHANAQVRAELRLRGPPFLLRHSFGAPKNQVPTVIFSMANGLPQIGAEFQDLPVVSIAEAIAERPHKPPADECAAFTCNVTRR